VSRILVIGGYGGFGARLVRRLAGAGHQVLVAGRSADKATAFCAAVPNTEPVAADRASGIGMIMARHRPDLVIDAAGPFQASGHTVPEACIAMRIPYLDLADGRDFVEGIAALDRAAHTAGIAAIAGASSVPALSGAVARKLADGLDRIDSLDMAISASNRASAGASVAAAILSYVGRPVRLWRGKRWTQAYGWQELHRTDFTLADGSGIGGRLTGIADVPDLGIVAEALPGRPSVTFRAGTELGFQMLGLWLASWPVRWGWLPPLTAIRRLLLPLYRMTLGLGSDRSAMHVTLKGRAGARAVERSWTLVASQGHGPEIPVLAAELLAGDILAGRVTPGARHAWAELTLDRFEPLFANLAIRHETQERDLPPPLYARAMGPDFAALPPLVRAVHEVVGDGGAAGEGTVTHGTNPLARAAAALMGMPGPGAYPLHVHFAERGGAELWTRDFGGQRFTSELSHRTGGVTERFGPIRFAFDLPGDANGLSMVLRGWSLFGVPLPRFLGPRIDAREWQEGDRFRYRVEVRLPLLGRAILYEGWLRPLIDSAPAAEARLQGTG
jgi:NAD(P)-dependent dehydrogenase (short-subunit alcohol dehydrogenase family)